MQCMYSRTYLVDTTYYTLPPARLRQWRTQRATGRGIRDIILHHQCGLGMCGGLCQSQPPPSTSLGWLTGAVMMDPRVPMIAHEYRD